MRLVPATRSFSKGKQFHMPAQVISAHKANCCFGLSSLRGYRSKFSFDQNTRSCLSQKQLSQRLASTRVPTSHGKKKKLVKLHFGRLKTLQWNTCLWLEVILESWTFWLPLVCYIYYNFDKNWAISRVLIGRQDNRPRKWRDGGGFSLESSFIRWLAVQLEFWTFWRHFYMGRYESVQTMENCCRFVK